jgi:hypothetical protein
MSSTRLCAGIEGLVKAGAKLLAGQAAATGPASHVPTLLEAVVAHQPPAHALIDTGALITGLGNKSMQVDGQQATIPDKRIRAFGFDFTRLILDPARMSAPLCDHDEVIYSDVWTAAKLKRVLPTCRCYPMRPRGTSRKLTMCAAAK